MCGIAGVYSRTKINCSVDEALEQMQHRGPDAVGTWQHKNVMLGMNRLAVVDHTTGSNQPMHKKEYTIVFNGEIYNYKVLRKELSKEFTFKTESDTEVLLVAYIKWKEDVVHHIHGMFAFAIYNENRKELFCCRDAVGQKPFVYAQHDTGFYFASEIPALLMLLPSLKNNVDVDALKLFMTSSFNHIPAPYTAYQHIKKLMPGSWIKVVDGKIIEERQWYYLHRKERTKTTEQVLKQVIKEMKVTEVPSASLLSGGVDSTLITLLTGCDGYTLAFSDTDQDLLRAKQVPCNKTYFDFAEETMLDDLDNQLKIVGEPYFHPTNIFADQVLGPLSTQAKVAFSGCGADEVYAGYNNKQLLAANMYCNVLHKDVIDFKTQRQLDEYYKIQHFFTHQSDIIVEDYLLHLNMWVADICDPQSFIEFSYMTGLFYQNSYALTMHGDVAGMLHSVEVRSPFLDTRVIEDGWNTPLREKIGKKPIKAMLEKYMSKEFVHAKKQGFGCVFSPSKELMSDPRITKALDVLGKSKIFNIKGLEAKEVNFAILMKLYAIGKWLEQQK